MSSDDAIVKVIMDMFGDSGMLTYYGNLKDKNGAREMEERKQRIHTSSNSMCKYYCDLNLASKSSIYESMLSDYQKKFAEDLGAKIGGEKLCLTLNDKEKSGLKSSLN